MYPGTLPVEVPSLATSLVRFALTALCVISSSTGDSRHHPHWNRCASTSQDHQAFDFEFIPVRCHQAHAADGQSGRKGGKGCYVWFLEKCESELVGKSDDYVKGKLKLKNLHGDALTNNKNYKYYAYFTKKSEDYLLNGWLRKDINTFQAWQELKLPNVKKLEDFDVAVLNTDKFRVYSRYVKDFDTNVRRKVHAGYLPPANMLGRSEVETTLRTLVMARTDIKDNFAKMVLGLTAAGKPKTLLKGDALTTHPDFKYFLLFKQEQALTKPRSIADSIGALKIHGFPKLPEVNR
ncbi:unnamed protein product [Phytophthora lilii]|uniref:Unnamed protein product n=1 Tax=Phytophthora lilii TaxID=2077276 RepID=A0A9W6WN70_9STRA|nr:unnamed protein product [Phytophthora lilii]